MAKRKALTKKIRFEVFKRDKFTCQYCGQPAPDVILEIDHIIPVAKGGDNEITNLITSCKACNAGKKHRELSDDSVIAKQKRQLDALEERRQQITMMMNWRNELEQMDNELLTNLVGRIQGKLNNQFQLNDNGLKKIRKWMKTFSFDELCDAIDVSAENYLIDDGYTQLSIEKFFNYIPKIANTKRECGRNPNLKNIYYIRGIVRNRMYCNEFRAKQLLEQAFNKGYSYDYLKNLALNSKNWTEWRENMETIIASEEENG